MNNHIEVLWDEFIRDFAGNTIGCVYMFCNTYDRQRYFYETELVDLSDDILFAYYINNYE